MSETREEWRNRMQEQFYRNQAILLRQKADLWHKQKINGTFLNWLINFKWENTMFGQVLRLKLKIKELEFDREKLQNKLDFEKQKLQQDFDLKVKASDHSFGLERQSFQESFELEKKAFEQDKTLVVRKNEEEVANLKAQLVLKHEQDLSNAKLKFDREVDGLKTASDKAIIEEKEKLNKNFYSEMAAELKKLHSEGNQTTKFMEKMALGVLDRTHTQIARIDNNTEASPTTIVKVD